MFEVDLPHACSLSVLPLMYGRLMIFLLAVPGGGVESSVMSGAGLFNMDTGLF